MSADYPFHPIIGSPEEYEEYQKAMREIFDQIEAETRDPLPEDFDDWVRQGNEHFARRFSQQT